MLANLFELPIRMSIDSSHSLYRRRMCRKFRGLYNVKLVTDELSGKQLITPVQRQKDVRRLKEEADV